MYQWSAAYPSPRTIVVSHFINDLPDCVQSSTRLFADDCVLYRQIKTQCDCEQLQEYLTSLSKWEEKWGMAFHPDKCSTPRVTRSKNLVESHYTLKGHVPESCDTIGHLGVKSQFNLSWNQHMDQVVKKGNNMKGFLRRNMKVSNEQSLQHISP